MPLDNTRDTDTASALKNSDLASLRPAPAVTRRMFVAGATITTGLALSVRPVRATAIKTAMDGLRGGMVSVPTSDGGP